METIIRGLSPSGGARQLKRLATRAQKETVVPAVMPEPLPAPKPVEKEVASQAVPPAPAPVAAPQIETKADAQANERRERELAQAFAEAEAKGYAEGFEKGEVAALEAVNEQVQRLASIAAALNRSKAAMIENGEDAMVEMVYAAVCRIVGEASVSRTAVVDLINRFAAAGREQGRVSVGVHPGDLDLIRQYSGDEAGASLAEHVDLRADASIRLGGCVIDGPSGSLDARLETQLERLREALISTRRSRTLKEEAL